MADEVEIEPEFEDEDEFLDRISQSTQPLGEIDKTPPKGRKPTDTPSVVEDVQVPVTTPRFTGKKNNNKKEVDQANKEAERRRREEQAEARRLLRERQQEQVREQRIQSRERLRASREQVTAARSEAIAGRVQSYSLAASLGFPGYVAASVVDSLFIRPKEDAQVEAQREYQKQLEIYQETLRRDQLAQKRAEEQAIRDMPITATEIDGRGKPVKNPPLPPMPPGTPPNVPPPANYPPAPPTPPSPPNVPPGSPPTPPNPPPNVPPPVPPTPPTPPPSNVGGGLGTAAIALTAAIQSAQAVNQAIDKLADGVSNTLVSAIKGDGIEASKSGIKTAQSIIDPLGVQIPLNVAVQSFDTLLDVNRAILDVARQNIAFAPQTLQADISGDLQKLVQSIELARKNDPTTAELIRANTQFEMAWAETRAKLLETLGPAIILLLQQLTNQVTLVGNGVQAASSVGSGFLQTAWPALYILLSKLVSNTEPKLDDLDDSDILNQIGDFFNPDRQRNQMRRNKTFPVANP